MTRSETEVVVGGGGPVGLACAIEARLVGLDVIVVEPRTGEIDKACGEGLMPGALPLLERLGVAPEGVPLRGVSYHDHRRRVEHRFAEGSALGVRRTSLHAALLARAEELGVRRVAARMTGVEVGEDSATVVAGGTRIRGEWLLACDGLHSPTARALGLARSRPATRRRFGQRRHFALEPWSDLIEVHWTPQAELYVTPTGDGMVGVAVLARPGVRYAEAVASCPQLRARLVGAPAVTTLRGAGPLRQSTTARTHGRAFLVGDAAGYVDALTGEGLRIGFAQAAAAVAALRVGEPRVYERDWHEITREFRRLTGAVVTLATSPLRQFVVPVARTSPALFGAAVERLAR